MAALCYAAYWVTSLGVIQFDTSDNFDNFYDNLEIWFPLGRS